MSRQGICILCVVLSSFALFMAAHPPQSDPPTSTIPKIKGFVFTGPVRPPLDESMFASMAEVGGNFVALVPEATVYRQSLKLVWDFEGQWYGEKTGATLQGIQLARGAGLKVMLKPHLEVGWDLSGWQPPELNAQDARSRKEHRASRKAYIATQKDKDRSVSEELWRGEFDVRDEKDWPLFAKNYREFILGYARLAEKHEVEMFCIGTELKRIALRRPEYWRELIQDVRQVYRGALVYAANWDSYEKIEFWDQLDFIGIDAYFPVSDSRTPTVEEIETGWKEHVKRIEALHRRFGKPVIFTEWGYEDEDFAGVEPWLMGRPPNASPATNREGQANAYEGTFRATWNEPWMHGVFVWRWAATPGVGDWPLYSPREKRAAEVLRTWFTN